MSKLNNNDKLDQFDRKILAALSVDGRMSVTELSRKLGISKTPCGLRLKRLMKDSFILGFRAVLNPKKLNLNHIAFVEVKLRETTESAVNAFNDAIANVSEIEQCHMIASSFDYLLKVRTEDMNAYRRVLGEYISTLPYVASTSTYVVMETVKESGVS